MKPVVVVVLLTLAAGCGVDGEPETPSTRANSRTGMTLDVDANTRSGVTLSGQASVGWSL